MYGSGCRVEGSRSGVSGSGFGVEVLGSRVQGFSLTVDGVGYRGTSLIMNSLLPKGGAHAIGP